MSEGILPDIPSFADDHSSKWGAIWEVLPQTPRSASPTRDLAIREVQFEVSIRTQATTRASRKPG